MLESLYRFCRFFGRAERKKEEKRTRLKPGVEILSFGTSFVTEDSADKIVNMLHVVHQLLFMFP